MAYSELRRDPITYDWVIISDERSRRPGFKFLAGTTKTLPDKDELCPFCPGNEHKISLENRTYGRDGVWWAKSVNNMFPALTLDAKIEDEQDGESMFVKKPGYGAHEVIIETPLHNQDIHQRSLDQVREMLWMYKERLEAYKTQKGLEHVLIWKNRGKNGGESIVHAHSQLIASPVYLRRLLKEIKAGASYFTKSNFNGEMGHCGYCDMAQQELRLLDKYGQDSPKNRVVGVNPFYAAFEHFASRFPFETWIVPRFHQADYSGIGPEEATHLAMMFQEVFSKLSQAIPDFDYNMWLHTIPFNSEANASFHWHFEIVPTLTILAGFDKGSETPINVVAPESAAMRLNFPGLNHHP